MAVKSRKPKTRENNSSFSSSLTASSSPFSPFFPSARVIVPIVLMTSVMVLTFLGGTFILKTMIQGKTLSSSFHPNNPNNNIKEKKVLVVVGEHKELNEAIIVNLIERGARVSVVRGRGGEGEFGRGWGGRVEREVVGDLETLEGQKEVVDEIERPERLDTIIFAQLPFHQPPSRQDNGEGIEKTLAFAHFSRRILLEGLVEKGFKGRVGSLGWAGEEDKQVKDLNGDFMYERGGQFANWVESNNALVLSSRKKNIDIYGINAPFQSIITILLENEGVEGKGREYISTFSPYLLPSMEDFADKLFSVLFSESIPDSHVFFNQFGEGIEISPYLSNEANIDSIWEQTSELVGRTQEEKEDESWKKW